MSLASPGSFRRPRASRYYVARTHVALLQHPLEHDVAARRFGGRSGCGRIGSLCARRLHDPRQQRPPPSGRSTDAAHRVRLSARHSSVVQGLEVRPRGPDSIPRMRRCRSRSRSGSRRRMRSLDHLRLRVVGERGPSRSFWKNGPLVLRGRAGSFTNCWGIVGGALEPPLLDVTSWTAGAARCRAGRRPSLV